MSGSANSVQKDVEPGSKTGNYYITIANLPFGTSWYELKDWLRHACAIDHVEVFNSSTSGWVRVNGHDNYERALSKLNNGEFRGRLIIADGRNANEAIKIKELIDTTPREPAASRPPRRGPTASNWMPTNFTPALLPTGHPQQWSSGSSAPMNQVQPMGPPGSAGPSSWHPAASTVPNFADSTANYSYPYMDPRPAVARQQSRHHTAQSLPVRHRASHRGVNAPRVNPEQPDTGNGSTGTAGTEQRRIIVRHLGQRTPEDILRHLVNVTLGNITADHDQLQHIDIPKAKDGRLRGHMFITFKTQQVAEKMARDLTGVSFRRRVLASRVTNEEIGPESKNTSRDKKKSRGKQNEKQEPNSPTSGSLNQRGQDTSASVNDSTRQRTSPVIVDGSTQKSKKSKKRVSKRRTRL